MLIRAETAGDEVAVERLLQLAFDTPAEARLVKALRVSRALTVALVGERNGSLVGAIHVSPMTLSPSHPGVRSYALAPLAVAPACQRQGLGSLLVRAAIRELIELRADALLVLGEPHWYQRFGFEPAANYQISCRYPVPPEYFMVLPLRAGRMPTQPTVANYHSAFRVLDDADA